MALEFSRQIFEKSSNIKFYKNPVIERRIVTLGPKDRHDKANSPFSQVSLTRQEKKIRETIYQAHVLQCSTHLHSRVLRKRSFFSELDWRPSDTNADSKTASKNGGVIYLTMSHCCGFV